MTINSIPASQLVQVIPSVIAAGAPPLSMAGLIVTEDASIPLGSVLSFPTYQSIANWFGPNSLQAQLAQIYFNGFASCTQLPGQMLFTPYNAGNAAAWVGGGSLAGMTLTQLKALTGTITVSINGTPYTTGTINLSGAVSFSAAAGLIQTALQAALASTTCTWDSLRSRFVITSPTTGANSAIAYPSDSSLSPSLNLQAAQGAVISQGAAAATPSGVMNAAAAVTSNWATFATDWAPDLATKQLFAAWVAAQPTFMYVCWDSDVTAEAPNASGSFGVLTASENGVFPLWNPTSLIAAFVLGAVASVNFQEHNGRTTLASKGQSGLTPDVTSAAIAANLTSNNYNFYGQWATATAQFQFLQTGRINGTWTWADSYINQIYFNSALQQALMLLLSQVKSIPYNTGGYSLISAALQPVINQMLNFGAAVPGVALAAAQLAQINAQAGLNIGQSLISQGYYLQILAPSAQVRSQRGTPQCTLWYVDGGSVQKITLASIDVQ